MERLEPTNQPLNPFPKKPEQEVVACPKCGCHYFIQQKIQQFQKMHNVIIGQPAPDTGVLFYALQCINCGELTEPQIIHSGRDMVRKIYDQFWDELDHLALQKKEREGIKL